MAIRGRAILAQRKDGPIQATIEAHGSALVLFTTHDQNEIIRNSLRVGGEEWIYTWLPKRFTEYAFELGYNQNSKTYAMWKQKVVGHNLPLVFTGALREMATKQARARATASHGTGVIYITIPTPAVTDRKGRHINYANVPRTQVGSILRQVPRKEIRAIAVAVEAALVEEIEGGLTARINPGGSVATMRAERGAMDRQARAMRMGPAKQRRKGP
jgi:hypothetical protein